MKKQLSIKIPEKLWVYIKDRPNKSRYIEELIKQDIHQAQVKPIVQTVIQELLSSETFFQEVRERLSAPVLEIKTSTPGYPCCKNPRPCKHWIFDGTNELWTNIITGEAKEG